MRHCPNQLLYIYVYVSMYACIRRKKLCILYYYCYIVVKYAHYICKYVCVYWTKKKFTNENTHICRFMEKKIKAPTKTVTIVLIDSCTVIWLQHFFFNVYLQRFTFR